MKELWQERYLNSLEQEPGDVLVGFNANIDVVFDVEELDMDLDREPEEIEKVSSLRELKASLRYCIENNENREFELVELGHSFDSGEEYIGGQAGIMANFLAKTGNGVIFYTPFLSEEIAGKIDEKVLYPVVEGGFVLKNVRDSANTDRTKRNLIFEYSGDETGRVIFSRKLKGFGPYFRKSVEENFGEIQENVDRIILSGFHDVEGNREAKLRKSKNQMQQLEKPVHVEFVHRNDELTGMISELILPEADSLGLDEDELRHISEVLGLDVDLEDETLGDVFHAAKQIIDSLEMERCHVHTPRFHVTVTTEDYQVEKEKIREAMLYGALSAVRKCDTGEIPGTASLENFDMDDKHVHDLDDLLHFQSYFGLENFAETGTAELENHRVVAIPTLIHEDPERLVGMGDIISAGAFIAETG